MIYGCVLDDSLLKEFWAFQRGNSYNAAVVEKLLRLYHPPYLSCNRQLVNCGIDDEDLKQGLMATGYVNQTLEELSQETLYKVVLTDQASDPSKGYFNIADSSSNKLGKYYSLTAKKNEPRTHLHDYLRKLLIDANNVILCDQYFDENFSRTKALFSLMPTTATTNVYFVHSLQSKTQQLLKSSFHHICYKKYGGRDFDNLHDRYIVIDKRIEVIITSGIDHLFDSHLTKECTIIVRQV
jgi:hypothetical protein